MMKRFILGFFLAVAFAGICAAEQPVRIGMSLGLTGQYAAAAKMQERGFRLWETQVNASGGILGRKVELTIHDDKSNVETAKTLYKSIIEKEHPDLLFAPYSSGITMAILPITEEHGYPMLISGAASDDIYKRGYHAVFGMMPPASVYSLQFLKMVLSNGFTKVAIISTDESFGKSVGEGAETWAKRLSMTIVQRATIKKDAKELDALAKGARDAGAEALLMCGHFNESVNMRKALKNINWYPKAYWASAGPDLMTYYEALGKDAEKTFSSTQWQYDEKLPYPGSKEFHQSFVAAYKTEPSYHAATAYTAGFLLQAAIKKAGGLDKKKIRDNLSSMDTMTLLGRFGVDETGSQIRYTHLITQWIDGHKEVVWPVGLKTSPRF